jgi:hypothetical protein
MVFEHHPVYTHLPFSTARCHDFFLIIKYSATVFLQQLSKYTPVLNYVINIFLTVMQPVIYSSTIFFIHAIDFVCFFHYYITF